ncbi:hypothetical protein IPH92_00645 [Candidatus Kaiserbacteria bacterium]|nr:MAG: hypothetical protein IPH92_00645 [Candidatus Kaiserbacteria bacterium]
MLELLFLYLVGFIVGLVLGIFSPILVPAWMIVLFGGLGIAIVSEAVGHWVRLKYLYSRMLVCTAEYS